MTRTLSPRAAAVLAAFERYVVEAGSGLVPRVELAQVAADALDSTGIDPRHLAGVAELAALFRVGRTTVSQWIARRDRNGFPEPVARLASGPIFDVNVVVAWYVGYVPEKGGRPGWTPRQINGTYAPGGLG